MHASTAFAGDPAAAPGPFGAGRKDVVVQRPNGSTFVAMLHYPAVGSGVNAPFDPSGGPYPIVSFGHGFLQPVSQYQSTLAHLASHGFFAIASQTNGGFAPNHASFALDLRFSADWLVQQNAQGAQFEQDVAVDRIAFSGHSMGGGAALLAAKDDPRERAVVVFAAADTNPSSIAACSSIATPTRLVVGSQDSIVPPGSSATPMYANLAGPKQLATIVGGFHCGFTDADFLFCDSGSIPRAVQLASTRALLLRFLDLHLRFDAVQPFAPWTETWGPLAPATDGVTFASDPGATIIADPNVVAAPIGGTASTSVVVTHLDQTPQSYAFEGPSVVFSPDATSVLGTNVSYATSAVVVMPRGAVEGDVLLVSAINEGDRATRAFTTITLAPSVPLDPADLDGNGTVDAADLAILLGAWGRSGVAADLDGDGVVAASDLAILLGAWK
jgi:dienelactone hydrolase